MPELIPITWTLVDGILTISGTGSMEKHVKNSDGFDVSMSVPWSGNTITKVVIEDGVTSISDYAFFVCSYLTSVTSIGDNASGKCSRLTTITTPDGVTSIGKSAFYCYSLKDVYYSGSEAQWNRIDIDEYKGYNDPLLNATIHFNS